MHVHTVRTKYTFGDRVRYSSHHNGSGTGTIVGICINGPAEPHYYIIDIDGKPEAAGGIYDDDITLLTDDPGVSTPVRV
jgi:hypothetical protein